MRNEEQKRMHKENQRLYRLRHPERVKASKKAYTQKNPDKVKALNVKHRAINKDDPEFKERRRKYHKKQYSKPEVRLARKIYSSNRKRSIQSYKLKRSYGITIEDKERMYTEQYEFCKVCSKKFASINEACVDHCHKTGVVRGLIHSRCNILVGFIERQREHLVGALTYLNMASEVKAEIE